MVVKADHERIKTLLKDTITLLCRNGLNFKTEFSVEALIGITLDKEDVVLVSINEIIRSELGSQLSLAKEIEEQDVAVKSLDPEGSSESRPNTPASTNGQRYRKRKRPLGHVSQKEGAEDGRESDSADDEKQSLEKASLLGDESSSEPASKRAPDEPSVSGVPPRIKEDAKDVIYIKEEIDTGDWPDGSQTEDSFAESNIPAAGSSDQQHDDNFDFLHGSSLVPVSSDASVQQSWGDVSSQSAPSSLSISASKRPSMATGMATQGEHSQRYSLMVCSRSSVSTAVLLPMRTEGCLDKMPVCTLCNKSFGSKFSYTRHMAQHWGRFTYSCDLCGQGFMVKGSLENHRRNHTGERLVCLCGAKFVSYQGYRQHQRKYNCLEKSYQEAPRRRWPDAETLSRPLPSRPAATATATATTTVSAAAAAVAAAAADVDGHVDMNRMWSIAMDVFAKKPFSRQCDTCKKTFTTMHGYSTHVSQHRGQFKYWCDICGQGFMVKGSLENHLRNHTGERLVCHCGASYISYQGYKRHVKKHECASSSVK